MLQVIITLIFTLTAVPLLYKPMDDIQTQIFEGLAYIVAFKVALTFIVGEITGNVSQVDKLWSISPIIYAWYTVVQAFLIGEQNNFSLVNDRMLMVAILITIWGFRLTYNFAIKGGYPKTWKLWTGEEDYRWAIIRSWPLFKDHRIRFFLFNLFFICFYQMVLIFLFTSPILLTVQQNAKQLGAADYLLGFLLLSLILFETLADFQQFGYQTEKYKLINAKKSIKNTEYHLGFCTRGLWKYSRHPNYFAEQSIWIVVYLICIQASGNLINWQIGGCVLLTILFSESAKMSEGVTAKKYPKYEVYQKIVPKFIPKFNQNKQEWKQLEE